MQKVTSKDGTPIAYERQGSGPPVVLVDGAFCYRGFGPMPELAPLLAKRFTVFWYDRRGRGDSGDTAPYAVERELEDLAAVLEAAGGSACVYGTSSGAALALRAAAGGLGVKKLAVYETPFVLDASRPPIPDDYAPRLRAALAEDRRGDLVKLFMRDAVRVPAFGVFMMRLMPAWSKLKAVAHTLPYDAAQLGDTGSGKPLPREWTELLGSVRMPTLVMGGGKSPPWLQHAVRAVAEGVPGAQLRMLEGQTHQVSAKVLAPALEAFFAAA